MLQVSDTAVSVLNEARSEQEVPDSYGIRVFAQPDESGEASLAIAFAEQPAEGDQVTEQAGTEVYVAPELAEPLASHVLDVADTPDGAQLTLVPQEGTEEG